MKTIILIVGKDKNIIEKIESLLQNKKFSILKAEDITAVNSLIDNKEIDCLIFELAFYSPDIIKNLFSSFQHSEYLKLLPKFIITKHHENMDYKPYLLYFRDIFYKPLQFDFIIDKIVQSVNDWGIIKKNFKITLNLEDKIKKITESCTTYKGRLTDLQITFNEFNDRVRDELMLQRLLIDKNDVLKKRISYLEEETQKYRSLVKIIIECENNRKIICANKNLLDKALLQLIQYVLIFKSNFIIFYIKLLNYKHIRNEIDKKNFNDFNIKIMELLAKNLRDKDVTGMIADGIFCVIFYNAPFENIEYKFEKILNEVGRFRYINQKSECKFQYVYYEINNSRISVKEIYDILNDRYRIKYLL